MKANVFDRYMSTLKKYFVFEGRASRNEYWTFTLLNMLIGFVLGFVETLMTYQSESTNIMGTLFQLVVFIPSIAVAVRRMHDVGKPGWYLLIPIYSLILSLRKGEATENKYGQNPDMLHV